MATTNVFGSQPRKERHSNVMVQMQKSDLIKFFPQHKKYLKYMKEQRGHHVRNANAYCI